MTYHQFYTSTKTNLLIFCLGFLKFLINEGDWTIILSYNIFVKIYSQDVLVSQIILGNVPSFFNSLDGFKVVEFSPNIFRSIYYVYTWIFLYGKFVIIDLSCQF
jgi:hypothetical protein